MFKILNFANTSIDEDFFKYSKKVRYFGYELNVPEWANYICMDEDGSVYVFLKKPKINDYEDFWESEKGDIAGQYVGLVLEYEGDYKTSLKKIARV